MYVEFFESDNGFDLANQLNEFLLNNQEITIFDIKYNSIINFNDDELVESYSCLLFYRQNNC